MRRIANHNKHTNKYFSALAVLGMLLFSFGQFSDLGKVHEGNPVMISTPTSLPCNLEKRPSSPIYLYILVDESLTANLSDENGVVRSTVTNLVIRFAAAYGWVDQMPPHVMVYQFGLQNNRIAELLWPESRNENQVKISGQIEQEDLFHWQAKITELLMKEREIDEKDQDEIPATLNYIKDQIQSNDQSENALVILITQGANRKEGPGNITDIKSMVSMAASKWQQTNISIGVLLFEKNSDQPKLLNRIWVRNFYEPVDSNSNIYLNNINSTALQNTIDNSILSWMFGIYKDYG